MTEFNLVWATPLLRVQTPTESLAERLREYILNCEVDGFRKPNSPQRPHDGVFESKFDFLSWPDPRVQEFREVLFGYLGSFVKLVNDLDDEGLNKLKFDNHCWFHITRNGGYFQPHNHPNASWSCIYCVDPGDETPVSESAAGHVMFTDPRQTNAYLDPANRRMRRDMSFNAIRLRLKPAEILF
ncbi:MAG: 2OG-Fe(II) oxygenase family protein, partial [Gammaproteobacteria bacterium]|nr:2OG-Fe(II) oxygenase family protein [Gammaproteobacteria bacterium]